jgi:hypothetical protein
VEETRPNELRQRWVATLPLADRVKVALLRLEPDLEIGESGETLWLRGETDSDEIPPELAKLPIAELFFLTEEDQLSPPGRATPVARLPEGLEWQSLASSSRLKKSPASLPARPAEKATLRLVRSERERESNLLWVTLSTLLEWVERAPEIRMQGLDFACSSAGEVFVKGTIRSIPAVSGLRFCEADGVAVPAGLELKPSIAPTVVHQLMGTSAGALLVFDAEAKVTVLEKSNFVALSRAAVRLTARKEAIDVGES